MSGERKQAPASSLLDSTRTLLRRAKAGDRRALETLCERYRPRLKRWARGRLPMGVRDVVDTDDLVQDALVKTIDHLDTFEPRHSGALQAYLHQVIRNRVRDEIRRVSHRVPRSTIDENQPDHGPSPLEQTVGREALRRYEDALHRLGENERQVIVMRVEMGADYEEIAEALGKPSSDAARMAVSRALVKLAREMG